MEEIKKYLGIDKRESRERVLLIEFSSTLSSSSCFLFEFVFRVVTNLFSNKTSLSLQFFIFNFLTLKPSVR